MCPSDTSPSTLVWLEHSCATNTINEYLKLGKSTALECLEYYCVGIIDCYGAEFLLWPTVADTQCLLATVEER
jgi:hypothetical protein